MVKIREKLKSDLNLPQDRLRMPTAAERVDLALSGPPAEQRLFTELVNLLEM